MTTRVNFDPAVLFRVPPCLGAGPRSDRIVCATFLVALILAAAHLLVPQRAQAECVRGAVNCTSMASMRTCTAMLACMNPPVFARWSAYGYPVNVTYCNAPLAKSTSPSFTLIARAITTPAAATRSCIWDWHTIYFSTSGSVSITTADGLPVELMNFAIEDGDAQGADDAEPASVDEDTLD